MPDACDLEAKLFVVYFLPFCYKSCVC